MGPLVVIEVVNGVLFSRPSLADAMMGFAFSVLSDGAVLKTVDAMLKEKRHLAMHIAEAVAPLIAQDSRWRTIG